MKTLLIAYILFVNMGILISQDYFNEIIPFQDGAPNSRKLIITENEYIIPIINYFGDLRMSSFLSTDHEFEEATISRFEGYSLARNSPFLIDGSYYSVCRNNVDQPSTTFIKLNSDFDTTIVSNVKFDTPYGGVTTSTLVGDYIYAVNHFDSSVFPETKGELNIMKFDTVGNLVWSKNYNVDDIDTYGWSLQSSLDDNLLLSSSLFYSGEYDRKNQILKLDKDGNVLWQMDGTEEFWSGGDPVWMTQLSDSNIVATYKTLLPLPVEYGVNRRPNRLVWYDRYGEEIIKKSIVTPHNYKDGELKTDLGISNIKRGKGDYFYIYGEYEMHTSNFVPDTLGIPGIIIKMNNQGDTIWSHLYKHPDNLTNDHLIRDIVELNDGDIVVMGNSRPEGMKADVWLFKINDEGCFGDESCEEKVYSNTNEIVINNSNQSIILSPNPSNGVFNIESENLVDIDQIKIYNDSGNLVLAKAIIENSFIDLSTQVKGVYHVKFYMSNGEICLSKVIKI